MPIPRQALDKYKFFCGIFDADSNIGDDEFAKTLSQGYATQITALLIAAFSTARDGVSLRRTTQPLVSKMAHLGISDEGFPPALREKLASAKKWRRG